MHAWTLFPRSSQFTESLSLRAEDKARSLISGQFHDALTLPGQRGVYWKRYKPDDYGAVLTTEAVHYAGIGATVGPYED